MRGRRSNRGDWLSPAAYNALSRDEKIALANRRQQQRFQHPRRSRRKPSLRLGAYARFHGFAALGALALIFGYGWINEKLEQGAYPAAASLSSQAVSVRFGSCHVGGGRNCVVDGDTFYMGGVKIRIAGIDAPETHPARCAREDRLGRAATRRLRQLLNSGSILMSSIDRDEDSYGRKLRNVQVNGADVGETLVSEGLARRYGGGKQPWC